MKSTLPTLICHIAFYALLVGCSSTNQPGAFVASSGQSAVDKCVQDKIKETKVVIAGRYSDPGGSAQKEAKQDCTYEKSKDPKIFQKKYGEK